MCTSGFKYLGPYHDRLQVESFTLLTSKHNGNSLADTLTSSCHALREGAITTDQKQGCASSVETVPDIIGYISDTPVLCQTGKHLVTSGKP